MLIWCSSRALSSSSTQPTASRTDKDNGTNATAKEKEKEGKDPPPPPLTDDQKNLLRGVQEDLIRMLAEKKIDVNVFSHLHEHGGGSSVDSGSTSNVLGGLNGDGGKGKAEAGIGTAVKENEQNVRNRARESTFGACIEK